MRKAYLVEFHDNRNGATSAIDLVAEEDGYTADDYIEDCKSNADDVWNEMLTHGEVILHELDVCETI